MLAPYCCPQNMLIHQLPISDGPAEWRVHDLMQPDLEAWKLGAHLCHAL